MNRPTPLHPNLVQLRVKWDAIVAQHLNGEISNYECHRQLSELRAFDDQGVQWVFTPEAEWKFIDSEGKLRPGTPPQEGIPGPMPEDFAAPEQPFFSPMEYLESEAPRTVSGSQRSGSVGWMVLVLLLAVAIWQMLS